MHKKRLLFPLIGLLLAGGFYAAGVRHHDRLIGLLTHGKHTVGRTTGLSESRHVRYMHYVYIVDGVSYEWNDKEGQLPADVDAPVDVAYLPEDPAFNRIGPPLTPEALSADLRDVTTTALAIFGISVVMFVLAVLGDRRKAQYGRAILSAQAAGRIVPWAFLLLILGALVLPEDSRQFNRKTFGEHPAGLSTTTFVVAAVTILFLPMFWVVPSTFLVLQRARGGGYGGKFATVNYLAAGGKLSQEERRALLISRLGGVYVVVLAVAWIAYTAMRGI